METDSFGISAWSDELDLEMHLSPNHGIESRSIRRVFDERNARIIFTNEPPKSLTKFFGVALLTELIDEVVLFALAFPGLNYTTTRVRSSDMSRIDAEYDRTDRQLERRKTLEMLRPCSQRGPGAETLFVK